MKIYPTKKKRIQLDFPVKSAFYSKITDCRKIFISDQILLNLLHGMDE